MGLSFRKSFRAGPFSINVYKSGLSYSTGIKGARINVGPRGTYVTFSSNGLQYRKRIGSEITPSPLENHQPQVVYSGIHTITSGAIENLTDTDSKDFVEELTEKANKYSLQTWLAITPFIIGLTLLLFNSFATKTVLVTPASDRPIATVTSAVGANVRSRPNAKSDIVKTAQSGDIFTLTDSNSGKWLKIQMNDTIGYLSRGLAETSIQHTDPFQRDETYINNPHFYIQLALLLLAFGILYILTGRLDQKRFEMEIHYEMDEQIKNLYT